MCIFLELSFIHLTRKILRAHSTSSYFQPTLSNLKLALFYFLTQPSHRLRQVFTCEIEEISTCPFRPTRSLTSHHRILSSVHHPCLLSTCLLYYTHSKYKPLLWHFLLYNSLSCNTNFNSMILILIPQIR